MLSASAPAFVGPQGTATGSAVGLRGASAAASPATPAAPCSSSGSATWLVCAASAAASVAVAGSRRSTRGSRLAKCALPAAVAAGEAPVVAPSPAVEEPPAEPPFDPATQVGATAPLGYFDPLGFCKVGDYEGFHKLRCAEIKHGRVAMMAAFGTVFQHFVKLPPFEATPAGVTAIYDGLGVLGFGMLLVPVIGFLELIYWKDDLSKEPGNFGDPGNWQELFAPVGGGYSDDIRNKEINNGRMAMISILGIVAAELATGKDGIQQFGF